MDRRILSQQIATLLNERNQLEKSYTWEEVFTELDNYVFIENNEQLIACAETRKVQWYQWEILHVSVKLGEEGKGYASKVLKKAEDLAYQQGAQVLQCTIRENNENSLKLFEAKGYCRVNRFFNILSKRWLFIYQKVISMES